MAKKRRTRKDKILSDLHRKSSYHFSPTSFVIEKNDRLPEKKIETHMRTSAGNMINYPFLLEDITRTIIVTGAIIAFQIFLFFILKFHVIKLPGIIY